MFVLVYTHERELKSQIYSLRSAGLFGDGPHVALRLVTTPCALDGGTMELDGTTLLDWRLFLTFGTALDVTSFSSARRMSLRLKRRFPEILSMVVGELAGPKALVANVGKEAGLNLILVPEGINIFRTQFGGYRWRNLSWKQGLGSRAQSALAVWRSRKDVGLNNLPLAYSLVGHLIMSTLTGVTSAAKRFSTVLDEVDLTVSKWAPDVEIPVISKSQIHLYPSGRTGNDDPPVKPRTAMILQSPEEIEAEDWREVLGSIAQQLSSVLIRWHRVNIGREQLKQALVSLGLTVEIDLDSGPLETREFSELPEYFIGSRSGALLDISSRYPNAQVVCVAPLLAEIASKRGKEIPGYSETHLMEALRYHSHGRIRFL